MRAPGALAPKREKEEAVVEKRLGVDCGSPGRICPITVSETISFFFPVTATACLLDLAGATGSFWF